MTNTLKFKTFCFEMYKAKKEMKGKEVQELFEQYKVYEYLDKHYDVLHSLGDEYLIEDIDSYINARK